MFYKGTLENRGEVKENFDLGIVENNKYINESMNIEINIESNWRMIGDNELLALSKIDKDNIVIGCGINEINEFKSDKKDYACPIGFNDKDTFSKVMILIKRTDINEDSIYDMFENEITSIEENSDRKFDTLNKKSVEIAGLTYENYRAVSSYYELQLQLDYYCTKKNGFYYVIKTYSTNAAGCNAIFNFLENIKSIN